jgi:hypothetical protein
MEKRLRKGDIGEAIFREWLERRLGELLLSSGCVLEQQGFNPYGFVDRSEKGHLKEKNDPDFAIYSVRTGRPIVGISVNTQAKYYTAESAMGKLCIKCPRSHSCYNSKEQNLWYNKYNLSDYAKFEQRFGVETCMVTLIVRVDSIARWVEKQGYEDVVHAYIFDGGRSLPARDVKKLEEFLQYLRHGGRKGWDRPVEIRWILRSELREITPSNPALSEKGIPFWTTGGRVERGKPREVCCVDARLARCESELIEYLSTLIKKAGLS